MENRSKKPKAFDAVKMMREIRDGITAETKHMGFDEFKRYIALKLKAASTIPPQP